MPYIHYPYLQKLRVELKSELIAASDVRSRYSQMTQNDLKYKWKRVMVYEEKIADIRKSVINEETWKMPLW